MIKYMVILVAAIGITVLHRFMNAWPAMSVDWFLFRELKQDRQWYVKDTLDMISAMMIIWVLWRVAGKVSRRLADVALLLLIYKFMGLVGYWMNYNTYDYGYIFAIVPVGIILIAKK